MSSGRQLKNFNSHIRGTSNTIIARYYTQRKQASHRKKIDQLLLTELLQQIEKVVILESRCCRGDKQ